jgi:hypothetical protein
MFPTTQNSATDLTSMLTHSKVEQDVDNGAGKAFLNFSGKQGEYSFGKEKEDVLGETLVVNTPTFRHGWALWVDRACTSISVPFVQDLPMPPASVPNKQGTPQSPSESRGFDAAFLDDPDTIVAFDCSTLGGRRATDGLLNAVKIRSASGEVNFLFPIIKLEKEDYIAGHGSKVYNPVFTITGWMDQAGNVEGNTAELAAPQTAEAEEQTPDKEEVQPKRRRRAAA